MDQLPAVYIIFTLLNAFRRGISRQQIWREFRRQGIAMRPRLSFWLALCVQAHLLREYSSGPRVTSFVPQWMEMPPDAQALHLLKAWQNAPKDKGERRFRHKLIWKLQCDQPLTQKDRRALSGLEALGLWDDARLTAWGKLLLKNDGAAPTPTPEQPWQIVGDSLQMPLHQRTHLLWKLETFLRPEAPGIYLLTEKRLHEAVNRGDLPHVGARREGLIEVLECGLMGTIPPQIRARILEQPSLQIFEGVVIEYSHPSDLEAARRNPNLRRHFEQVLSPRHVLLASAEAPAVLRMLRRRGIQLSLPEPQAAKPKRAHFYRTPLAKPVGQPTSLVQLLEKYSHLQQALDILYQAPGRQVERRRITPLLIEQRGEHTYVTAYCQSRRAQRVFRLDRMEIAGEE